MTLVDGVKEDPKRAHRHFHFRSTPGNRNGPLSLSEWRDTHTTVPVN